MKNREISTVLYEISSLLEIDQENPFRIRAYTRAAQTLENLTEDVESLAQKDALTQLPGVGKGIAEKIKEFCSTGKMAEYEHLKQKYSSGILEMMQISGMGPKRTRILFQKLKIDSVEKLKEAAQKGWLKDLEGFGAKIEENILKGISLKDQFSKRMLLDEALRISQEIVKTLSQQCRSLEKIVPAGSLRRWKETVGDLDFLTVSEKPEEVIHAFTHRKEVKRVLAEGSTKASVLLDRGVQCDLRVVPKESFGAALQYFTGSKEHNVALRELALKKGLTINEYGLYHNDDKKKSVAGKTEEEIYKKLGLEFVPPELRENRGEIEAAQTKKLPKLIEEKDIRGDFHNHTKLSDGTHSLEEMAQKAKEKGWEWFVSADHSQSLKVARGLDPETLWKKKKEIEILNQKWNNFNVLLGSEVDILSDGTMDYADDILKEIDFVVASVHTGFSQGEEKLTERIVKAMGNPYVDIVGHLTGRLLGSREPYPIQLQRILDAAAKTQTAMEINGQPQRLDLYDSYAQSAKGLGVPIVLTTDAHSTSQLDYMTYAVATARRAWLRKEDILNCLSLKEILDWKNSGVSIL